MSDPEDAPEPVVFEAAPFDAVADLCGDPIGAGLRMLFAGNQYMGLPDLVAGFADRYPQIRSVFYETLPPGIVLAQLRAGRLRMGALELAFVPDVVAASPAALGQLAAEGLVGPARTYASNVLALMVAAGNPAGVTGITDLGRPGLRVALPDPATEGIGRLALRALDAAGGSSLRHEVEVAKRRAGQTTFTRIHHRQTPAWIADGLVDVGVVWETEGRHHTAIGSPLQAVAIDDAVNQSGCYAAAVVEGAPHHDHAEAFVDYLAGQAGRAVYARFGFSAEGKRPS